VDPEYDDLDLATGDIVLAKTGEDQSDWIEVGVMIRPPDLGASRPGAPVVLTATGLVGELGSTLPSFSQDDLFIVPGEPIEAGELFDELLEIITTSADPADESGAALIDEVGGLPGARPRVRGIDIGTPGRGLTGYLARVHPTTELSFRRCPFGDPMPCQHSLGQPQ
jgi:hypothetical protein